MAMTSPAIAALAAQFAQQITAALQSEQTRLSGIRQEQRPCLN